MNKDDIKKLLDDGYKQVGIIIGDDEASLAIFIEPEDPRPVDGVVYLTREEAGEVFKIDR